MSVSGPFIDATTNAVGFDLSTHANLVGSQTLNEAEPERDECCDNKTVSLEHGF